MLPKSGYIYFTGCAAPLKSSEVPDVIFLTSADADIYTDTEILSSADI